MCSKPLSGSQKGDASYVVVRPRAGDAIGEALRGAFAGEFSLPDDMMAALRALDKIPDRVMPA